MKPLLQRVTTAMPGKALAFPETGLCCRALKHNCVSILEVISVCTGVHKPRKQQANIFLLSLDVLLSGSGDRRIQVGPSE